MLKLWEQMEASVGDSGSRILHGLRDGATKAQVTELEATLGFDLPSDLVESLRRHDGQERWAKPLFGSMAYSRCHQIALDWQVLTDLLREGDFAGLGAKADRGIDPVWWSDGWVPFAANAAGDHVCVDAKPARGGEKGQIITFNHEMPSRKLLAPSFEAWFRDVLKTGGQE